MSTKLRALLKTVKSETTNSDFSVVPLNEKLLQSITGGNTNYSCSNNSCSTGKNSTCVNDCCHGTKDSGCTNQH